jgi:transposase-like protein
VCPECGAATGWVTARGAIRCKKCQRQTSATAGTIFAGTRKPLRTWFQAIWYVTNQKLGVSALGLQRVLGFGSYQTAWAWLHKLRRAMVRPGRDRLTGEVEVDETYVGGVEPGVAGRGTKRKALVVIAAEVRGRATGRVRMARVKDASGESLLPFVQRAVVEGSVIRTDGWLGYRNLGDLGYDHQPKSIAASGEPGHVVMPRVHLVASLLDRWWLGTHQGAILARHLDYYLDEFTFRFNRRRSRARGLLFYRLVQHAALVDPAPYRTLVGGTEPRNHKM